MQMRIIFEVGGIGLFHDPVVGGLSAKSLLPPAAGDFLFSSLISPG
jgi:hypothetical protein